MRIECTGRQVTVTASLRSLAQEGIERIGKVLGKTGSAHIVLTSERRCQIAEVTIKTRACSLVALCESTVGLEAALREALGKAEAQALRHKNKLRAQKRQPKEEKQLAEPPIVRAAHASAAAQRPAARTAASAGAGSRKTNGKSRAVPAIPVTVHSFPARQPIAEPHVVRSSDSVALRPMTLEEAVKEAEFRDREVFVFRDNRGNVKVLHRKRDGKMELIEAPWSS